MVLFSIEKHRQSFANKSVSNESHNCAWEWCDHRWHCVDSDLKTMMVYQENTVPRQRCDWRTEYLHLWRICSKRLQDFPCDTHGEDPEDFCRAYLEDSLKQFLAYYLKRAWVLIDFARNCFQIPLRNCFGSLKAFIDPFVFALRVYLRIPWWCLG